MKKSLWILLFMFYGPAYAENRFYSLNELVDYTPDPERTYVIKNMPPPTNQQGLNLCYAHSAATIMNYHNCVINKKDCMALPASELASPIDVARFGTKPDGELEYESSYRGIPDAGGPSLATLEIAALFVGSSASQACFNEDTVFGELSRPDLTDHQWVQKQRAEIEKLKKIYSGYQASKCKDCSKQVSAAAASLRAINPKLQADDLKISKALSEETYDKFFDRLFFPKECARAKNRFYFEGRDSYELKFFPEKNSKPGYVDTFKKIKEVVKSNSPILASICLGQIKNGKCTTDNGDGHAVVIYGYSQVCKENICMDAVKVRSSWGDEWEKKHGANWFDAKRLIDSFTEKGEQQFGWLQPKPEEPPQQVSSNI